MQKCCRFREDRRSVQASNLPEHIYDEPGAPCARIDEDLQSVKPELRVLKEKRKKKNWLSQNAAGFDCKEASAGTELAEEEGGGGGRAGRCPELRVCHPQLERSPSSKLITELYSHIRVKKRAQSTKNGFERQRCASCLLEI